MTMYFKPKPTKRPRDYKYHIVLSFRDLDETYYVVRYYGIYKQWWHYEIWDSDLMELNKKRGYKIVKHRNIENITSKYKNYASK